jgi:hypothetical protein
MDILGCLKYLSVCSTKRVTQTSKLSSDQCIHSTVLILLEDIKLNLYVCAPIFTHQDKVPHTHIDKLSVDFCMDMSGKRTGKRPEKTRLLQTAYHTSCLKISFLFSMVCISRYNTGCLCPLEIHSRIVTYKSHPHKITPQVPCCNYSPMRLY